MWHAASCNWTAASSESCPSKHKARHRRLESVQCVQTGPFDSEDRMGEGYGIRRDFPFAKEGKTTTLSFFGKPVMTYDS